LYKLNPVDPQLESAWFQPVNLQCDLLVSSLSFQMQLVLLHNDAFDVVVGVGVNLDNAEPTTCVNRIIAARLARWGGAR
jgi:hypothetical protein